LHPGLKVKHKMQLQEQIEKAWADRELLKSSETQEAIREVVDQLDKGKLRVAEPSGDGWKVNEWIKKAVILYFPIQQMETIEVGPFEFHDKIALKKNYKELGVRVVPHAIARHGSFVNRGVIMMPSYVISARMSMKVLWWTPGLPWAVARRLERTFT
jgi:2,3,4,5-tetrahydropyridine-2-carboxylate N-succinyltransferase